MKTAGMISGLRDLDGLSVSELRVELAEARRVRAMLDARVVEIVARLEASMTVVGAHEPGIRERCIPEVELVARGGMTRREASDVVRRAHVIEDAPGMARNVA